MEDEKTKEELEKEFFRVLTWYFQERPTGFYQQLGHINGKLGVLNTKLEESSSSSEHLASALNRLTLAGVIVAGLGVATAIGHLIFEIVKYANAH